MINPALFIVGAAVQATEGVAAAAPAFTHGLVSGSPFNPSISNEDIKETGTNRMTVIGSRRNEIGYNGSLGMIGHEDILGWWLYAACGAVATTGAGPTYEHVFVPGSALPLLTVFSKMDAEDVTATIDTKVDGLEVAFEGVKELDINVDLIAAKGTWLGGTWGGPEQVGRERFFTAADCEILISPTTGTPVALSGTAVSGSMKIANAVSADYAAGSAEAQSVTEGLAQTSGSMTIKPKDSKLARSVLTGSETGTKVSAQQIEGSFKWSFTHNKDSALSLVIEATGVPFSVSSIEADPEGGVAEVDLEFSKAQSVTVTLVNETASYTA